MGLIYTIENSEYRGIQNLFRRNFGWSYQSKSENVTPYKVLNKFIYWAILKVQTVPDLSSFSSTDVPTLIGAPIAETKSNMGADDGKWEKFQENLKIGEKSLESGVKNIGTTDIV